MFRKHCRSLNRLHFPCCALVSLVWQLEASFNDDEVNAGNTAFLRINQKGATVLPTEINSLNSNDKHRKQGQFDNSARKMCVDFRPRKSAFMTRRIGNALVSLGTRAYHRPSTVHRRFTNSLLFSRKTKMSVAAVAGLGVFFR